MEGKVKYSCPVNGKVSGNAISEHGEDHIVAINSELTQVRPLVLVPTSMLTTVPEAMTETVQPTEQ